MMWGWETITFAADGSIVTVLDARGDGTMGGMVVSDPRVQAASPVPAASVWSQ